MKEQHQQVFNLIQTICGIPMIASESAAPEEIGTLSAKRTYHHKFGVKFVFLIMV